MTKAAEVYYTYSFHQIGISQFHLFDIRQTPQGVTLFITSNFLDDTH